MSNADDLDQALATITAALDYPMLVVTATSDGQRAGCLVGFATQCSIHPTRFTVWISNQNHTYRVARRAEWLAVHLLDGEQRPLAELFGATTGDDADKFARCSWHEGPGPTTVLDQCSRWFAGPVISQVDGGDHVGFIVQPARGHAGGDWTHQLGFQMVRDLAPGHPA